MSDFYNLQSAHPEKFSRAAKNGRTPAALIVPKTIEDLKWRGKAFYGLAAEFGGFLGRTPDYMNAIITSWSAAAPFFGGEKRDFAANITNYYHHIIKNDLAITHSVVNPSLPAGRDRVLDPNTALRVTGESADGIVVSGLRQLATSAAVSDEIAIYSGRIANFTPEQKDFALAFAMPVGADGLKLIGRTPYIPPTAKRDYPLGSRFEEMDCLVEFDEVLVPWDRVFIYKDPGKINQMHQGTNSVVHSAHQTACKCIAKTEFVLGALLNYTEVNRFDQLPHVQQTAAKIMVSLEVMRALVFRAEAEASLDQWGVMAPALVPLEVARAAYMQMYQEVIQGIRATGSGNLMQLFSEKDLVSDRGAKVKWNKVLWDLSCSAFGTRQELYEKLYAGGVEPSLSFLFKVFPESEKDSLKKHVREILEF